MSNASEYADSISADIKSRSEAGSPFGWIHDETEEWTGDPVADMNDYREAGALDYLSDVLDIQYLVSPGSDEITYLSARILISFGGPNAWIDTRTSQLEVTWWSAPEYRDLPADFIADLDEALSELWESR